jgi:hypothetical protein
MQRLTTVVLCKDVTMVRLTTTNPECSGALIDKVRSTDPKGCATSSQGIRGYLSVGS